MTWSTFADVPYNNEHVLHCVLPGTTEDQYRLTLGRKNSLIVEGDFIKRLISKDIY